MLLHTNPSPGLINIEAQLWYNYLTHYVNHSFKVLLIQMLNNKRRDHNYFNIFFYYLNLETVFDESYFIHAFNTQDGPKK